MQPNTTPTPRPRPSPGARQIRREARREAKKEARDEVRRLARKRAKANGIKFRGGSSLKPKKRKLHISEYLASLLCPEMINVPAPSLGPYPTREFTLKSVWEVKLNTSAAVTDAVCFDVNPAQLTPLTFSTSSLATFAMVYGNSTSQSTPTTLIGTGQVNKSSGPAWLVELRTRAGNAFLNSAGLKIDYIGGTFNDAGLMSYVTSPILDRNSTAAAPPLSSALATWPLGGSVPTPEGLHLFWLPGEYGRAERVLIDDYTNTDGTARNIGDTDTIVGLGGQGVSSFWRIFATTGVANGESVFRVTLTQNFSFISSDKLFAATPSAKAGWSSPMQGVVEQRALARAVHNPSGNSIVGVPTSRVTRNGDLVENNQFQKQRTESLSKFLKGEWDKVSPYVGKLLWDNKGAIGNYISDMVTPASTQAGGWTSEVIAIEEVGEEAAEVLPLLAV